MPFPSNSFFPAFPKEFSHFLQTIDSHSWDLLENAKKNLVFHFGVGRQASFPLRWSVKSHVDICSHFRCKIKGSTETFFKECTSYTVDICRHGDETMHKLGLTNLPSLLIKLRYIFFTFLKIYSKTSIKKLKLYELVFALLAFVSSTTDLHG